MFKRVAELKAQGVDLISLAVGEPDSEPPDHVLRAAKQAIDAGASRYTEVSGLIALRRAICADSEQRRKQRHEPDQVVVSAGAKHTLFNLAQVLFDHGDEVVIPVPAWGSYAEQARLCGAEPVLVPCAETDGFLVRPEQLARALSARTKAVVLCTPSNPTGAAYGAAELGALARVLERSDAYVIVDEIYAELMYDGAAHVSLLELAPSLRERLVIVDGVSKRFAMTGYRVGWMLGPRALALACEAVQSQATTSVAAVSQLAAKAALEAGASSVLAMRAELEARRDRLLAGINALPGLRARRPQGAFYLFAAVDGLIGRGGLQNDVDVTRFLLERARVAVVPGSAFLDRAVERIAAAIDTLE
jgi:aspartate aminotransferase